MQKIVLVLLLACLASTGLASRLQPQSHSSQGRKSKDGPGQMDLATEEQPQEKAKHQSRSGGQTAGFWTDGGKKIPALLLMALLVCSLCLGCACYTASRGSGRQNASPSQPGTLLPSGPISPGVGNSNTNGLGWWALRVPGAVWPSFLEKEGKFFRFIDENDLTFQKYVFDEARGYSCKTPEEFRGTRKDGVYEGSFRVQFTLPEKDDEPKTIELMRSREEDKPSFGAVKVTLPIDISVFSKDSRMLVKRVSKGSSAETARIREGDIIRAVSLTETDDNQEEAPKRWFSGNSPVPAPEEGLAVLDGKSVAEYNAVLQENARVLGKQAQVVFILERPDSLGPRAPSDHLSRASPSTATHSTAVGETGDDNDYRPQGSMELVDGPAGEDTAKTQAH